LRAALRRPERGFAKLKEANAMPSISLKVTRPPGEGADLRAVEPARPLFRGNGDTDYLCGNCGAVIAASMGPRQHVIVDTTTCPACGAENEFPVQLRA
jgi:hypothetical protein